MTSKIPATVVTGFLGAGKTTLIRHLLQNAGGRRIALVINEFGDLGVDGEILKGCGDETCREEDVVELSNGCICCTVAEDFIPTIETLLSRPEPPEHIVIETSGLALPQPLVRAFNWPDIATRVTVDAVVTVVDGPAVDAGRFAHDHDAIAAQRAADDTLDHDTPLADLFKDQLSCADMIVVNKTDLMTDAAATAARLRGGARDGVQVVRAAHGALPIDVLLGQGHAAETDMAARHEHHHEGHHHEIHDHHGHDHEEHDHDGGHHHGHHHHGHHHHGHHHHDHDDFESFIVTRAAIDDPAAFAARLSQVIRDHDILRLKGFAAVTGKPMRLTLQAVGPRVDSYFDRPLAAAEADVTRLVVIGQAGLDRAAITAALAA